MQTSVQPSIDIRRGGERFHTDISWLDSRHSFSFGQHYSPDNTHFGLLLVSNDDIVRPNTGFSTHPHRDMEIVTWVIEGELEHKDSEGHKGIIHPGLAQRMSAGTGIWHSEMNATQGGDVHFVQMWVVPDTESTRPSYQELDIGPDLGRGDLIPLASGQGHEAAISIRQEGATLWAGRLQANRPVKLPSARFVHVYVAAGEVTVGEERLSKGDAARMTHAAEGQLVVPGPAGAEVLIWEMHGRLA